MSEQDNVRKPALKMFPKVFVSNQNLIPIYTAFKILVHMKQKLGLEPMLEYIAAYTEMIEQANPRLKTVVDYAVDCVNVEKIYKEALS